MKVFMRVLMVAAAVVCGGMAFGVASPARAADKVWSIDEVIGNPNAPNTIIEYSSMTCPHCAHFMSDTFPKIKAELIDTGKVKLIHRDYPLDTLSLATAMIAHCSGDRYFAFLETFFKSQDSWAHATDPMTSVKSIARLGGMTADQVDACILNKQLMVDITDRRQEGLDKYKVESTPSFLVNGQLLAGAQPYEEFVKLLKK